MRIQDEIEKKLCEAYRMQEEADDAIRRLEQIENMAEDVINEMRVAIFDHAAAVEAFFSDVDYQAGTLLKLLRVWRMGLAEHIKELQAEVID